MNSISEKEQTSHTILVFTKIISKVQPLNCISDSCVTLLTSLYSASAQTEDKHQKIIYTWITVWMPRRRMAKKKIICISNSPSGVQTLGERYSEEPIGMEIDSWVVENEFLLHPSSSLKNGRLEFVSCFRVPSESTLLPKKQYCCCCFDIAAPSSLAWGKCNCVESPCK